MLVTRAYLMLQCFNVSLSSYIILFNCLQHN